MARTTDRCVIISNKFELGSMFRGQGDLAIFSIIIHDYQSSSKIIQKTKNILAGILSTASLKSFGRFQLQFREAMHSRSQHTVSLKSFGRFQLQFREAMHSISQHTV